MLTRKEKEEIQRRTRNLKNHYVYILTASNRIKIGYSMYPNRRAKNISSAAGEKCSLALQSRALTKMEAIMHENSIKSKFFNDRAFDGSTEWFINNVKEDILTAVRAI